MRIPVGVSARHIHLNEETYTKLFGDNLLVARNSLTQPGEFASESVLTIKSVKSEIENVRVLGPLRSYNQVEISASDAYKLGINPPVRKSGVLEDAVSITLVGPNGSVVVDHAVIIAERHIHMSKEEAGSAGFKDGEGVTVKIAGVKKGTIEANIKIMDNAYTELHIDVDDANAFLLKSGDWVDIVNEL